MLKITEKPGLNLKDLREFFDKRKKVLKSRIRLLDEYTNDKRLSGNARSFASGRMYSMKLEVAHIRNFLEAHTVLEVHTENK